MSEQQLGAATITAVAELAKESARFPLKIVNVPGEPKDVYYIVNEKTGTSERRVAAPDPQRFRVFDTASIVALAKKANAEIIYSDDAISISHSDVADGFTRTITHTMNLRITMPFSALRTIEGKTFAQRDFWNMLRTVFFEGLSADQIAIFKNVKWSNGGSVEQQVGHAKESLGKSYTHDVIGEGAIPEYLKLSVPVYDIQEVRARRYPILCAVDTNVDTKSFRLIPVAGAISRALDEALDDLMAPIMAADLKGVPILRAS
jgi:hypothetical protein